MKRKRERERGLHTWEYEKDREKMENNERDVWLFFIIYTRKKKFKFKFKKYSKIKRRYYSKFSQVFFPSSFFLLFFSHLHALLSLFFLYLIKGRRRIHKTPNKIFQNKENNQKNKKERVNGGREWSGNKTHGATHSRYNMFFIRVFQTTFYNIQRKRI